jgi:hypothetical protein
MRLSTGLQKCQAALLFNIALHCQNINPRYTLAKTCSDASSSQVLHRATASPNCTSLRMPVNTCKTCAALQAASGCRTNSSLQRHNQQHCLSYTNIANISRLPNKGTRPMANNNSTCSATCHKTNCSDSAACAGHYHCRCISPSPLSLAILSFTLLTRCQAGKVTWIWVSAQRPCPQQSVGAHVLIQSTGEGLSKAAGSAGNPAAAAAAVAAAAGLANCVCSLRACEKVWLTFLEVREDLQIRGCHPSRHLCFLIKKGVGFRV